MKQSYTEVLIELKEGIATIKETSVHLANHLKNIDSHLDRLNNTVTENRIYIQKNKGSIGWICKIGGMWLLFLTSFLLGMKLFGVI